MNGIWSDCGHSHQIGVDVLVEHWSIVEDTTLRMDVLNVVLGGNAQYALWFISTAKVELPHEFGFQIL